MEFYEHLGTHIDAPIHFGAGRQTLEEIPARNLIGPGVVLDVREKVKNNSDYAVTVQDINGKMALFHPCLKHRYLKIPMQWIYTFGHAAQ